MTRLLLMMLGLLLGLLPFAAQAQSLEADLRALDAMRKGLDTPLDEVDGRGEALLKQYEEPAQQAQIYYQLAHVHAQSGMKQPAQILKYAQTALDSKLVTPEQRGVLYSYIGSAHEVDPTTKDFATRRKRAGEAMLKGWQELNAFGLPDAAPELPPFPAIGDRFGDPVEQARRQREAEAAQRARQEVARIRDLVQRRAVLKDQLRWLYARDPVADEELTTLATKEVGADLAKGLLQDVKAERERRIKKP